MIHFVNTVEGYHKALGYLTECNLLGVDTETTGVDPYLSRVLLLQVGDENHQYVFDVFQLQRLDIDFKEIKQLLENPLLTKIGHNLLFDYKMLKVNLNIELEHIFDTMIAEYLLTKGAKLQGFGLADVLDKYGIEKNLSKEERKTFLTHLPGTDFTVEQIKYAGKDVENLIPLARQLHKLLIRDGMEELMELENNTVLVTADMELAGICLDKAEWEELASQAAIKRNEAKEKLLEYLPEDFDPINLLPPKQKEKIQKKQDKQESLALDIKATIEINFSSPIQVAGFLTAITGKEPPDTNEKTLYKVYTKSDGSLEPVVKALLDYREADKLATTYGMSFYDENIHPITGRIHSNFIQLGADSGRFASRNPNMQNLPANKAYRAAFKAAPGYKMICADLAQFELRVLAELSGEQSWIDVMNDPNGDLHRYVASMLYDIPEDQITKPLRTIGKSLNFGVAYGAGPTKLMEVCNKAFTDLGISKQMTFDEAKVILNRYRVTFSKVNKTLEDAVKDAKVKHYALSPLDGRRRYLHIDWSDPAMVAHAGNIAKNMLCQAVNASVTKRALVNIRKRIKENNYDAKIINTVHDEIEVEVLESQAEDLAKIVEQEFILAGKYYLKKVPVSTEVIISDKWEK